MDHTVINLLGIKEEINSKNSNNKKIVKIVAVTKTFEPKKFLHLLNYGHHDFGENKVQEAITKWTEIKKTYKDVKLHMIGKLQTNKVKQAVKVFDYIHSVDSIKLAEKISLEQKKIDKNIKIFIQINIGEESQKNGIELSGIKKFLDVCRDDLKLQVLGLMCIPPNEKDVEKYFSKMLQTKNELNLKELSMGMSNDYLQAIKYEASYVRIGSKIFGKRSIK
tara:strand:+ start:8085 stop:8747 length:663 start_codon:yes stop_codon:yes gene_type:complete